MIDKYKHDPAGVTTVINALKADKESYSTHVNDLKNIVKEIEASSAWKDASVKTEFINTCNSYIRKYDNILTTMEQYIEYLTNKNDEGSSTENSFAKVGQNG